MHMVDEVGFYEFIVGSVSEIGEMVLIFPGPVLDGVGPAEGVKFGEFVAILVKVYIGVEGEIFVGFLDPFMLHDKAGRGLLSSNRVLQCEFQVRSCG